MVRINPPFCPFTFLEEECTSDVYKEAASLAKNLSQEIPSAHKFRHVFNKFHLDINQFRDVFNKR